MPTAEKGRQLDQGFQGDGRHQAFVALGGVQVTGPEKHAEEPQEEGHDEGRIDIGRQRRDEILQRLGRMGGEKLEGVGNRLQLQGDVRHDADDGEDGDDGPQGFRFAVAARNEVGDADDVVLFADPDDFAQQKPPGEGQKGGAEVHRKKVQADGGGPADAAVKGP